MQVFQYTIGIHVFLKVVQSFAISKWRNYNIQTSAFESIVL